MEEEGLTMTRQEEMALQLSQVFVDEGLMEEGHGAILRALQDARNAALEEAATLCDKCQAFSEANSIRALKA